MAIVLPPILRASPQLPPLLFAAIAMAVVVAFDVGGEDLILRNDYPCLAGYRVEHLAL